MYVIFLSVQYLSDTFNYSNQKQAQTFTWIEDENVCAWYIFLHLNTVNMYPSPTTSTSMANKLIICVSQHQSLFVKQDAD